MKRSFRPGIGVVFTGIALLLAAAGTILYSINASGSYYHDLHFTVILLGIGSIFLLAVFTGIVQIKGEQLWTDIFYPAAGILLALAAIIFVSYRVESAGIILGSDLEAGNKEAMNSLIQSFIGSGCFLAASVMTGISSFFRQVKEQ